MLLNKIKEIKVEYVHPHKLVPWERNPRNNKAAIEEVAKSIEGGNFDQPILVDQNMRICKGHTRFEASKLLGLSYVPIIKEDMNEKEFIERALSDNKTAELAKWDKKLLNEAMTILENIGPIEVPGFDDKDIDDIFGHKHIETHVSGDADFGDDGKIKIENETEGSARIKRIVFMLSPKQHEMVSSKLQAIKKEHGLDDQVEALIEALRPYKGLPKVIKRSSKVKDIA